MATSSQRNALDLAVVHLTFEGIQTFGGGVATVTRGHLGALPRLRQVLGEQGIKLTPYFAEIAYAADHERRDRAFQRHAEETVAAMGGRIAYLVNLTQGYLPRAPWGVGDLGGMENWKVACASGAAEALNVARQHEMTVVYGHDSLFALAPLYITLQAGAFGADVTAIYVVHSTALTHELPLPNPERLMAESVGVHWAKVTPQARVGYISQFIARHLTQDYGVHAEHLVPTGNGVNPGDPSFRLRDRQAIQRKLAQYGIPLDRPLVFSWGRSVAYKRYDVVLRAAARLRGRVQPVIMVTPEYPALVELSRELGLDTTFVFAFDPELVASLLQWDNTIAACSLAYLEPFGLTPIEVRILARQRGPLMVVSNTGGLAEQVRDGVDGFVTRQDDADDVARVLERILALAANEKDRVRKAGLATVLAQYTWSSQILRTLAAVVPAVAAVADDVRSGLVATDQGALV